MEFGGNSMTIMERIEQLNKERGWSLYTEQKLKTKCSDCYKLYRKNTSAWRKKYSADLQ